MSDNDKWVWSNEDEPIPALLRPEPSTSKTDTGLRLDLMAPGAAKTPAASASQAAMGVRNSSNQKWTKALRASVLLRAPIKA